MNLSLSTIKNIEDSLSNAGIQLKDLRIGSSPSNMRLELEVLLDDKTIKDFELVFCDTPYNGRKAFNSLALYKNILSVLPRTNFSVYTSAYYNIQLTEEIFSCVLSWDHFPIPYCYLETIGRVTNVVMRFYLGYRGVTSNSDTRLHIVEHLTGYELDNYKRKLPEFKKIYEDEMIKRRRDEEFDEDESALNSENYINPMELFGEISVTKER